MSDHVEQELPEVNEQPFVHDQVAIDVLRRGQLGKQRYGTKLQPFNGRDAARDMYEEFLDGACYALQVATEMEALRADLEKVTRERDILAEELKRKLGERDNPKVAGSVTTDLRVKDPFDA